MATLTFTDLFDPAQLSSFGSPLTVGDIVLVLLASFLTGMFIFFIYKKTFSGVLYSKNFNISLVMTSMITSVIMMAIGGNLALTLGMVGALSIVRFRTPIKDSKDLTFLFWSITVGIANGVQFYKLTLVSSLVIGLVLYALSKKIVLSRPYVAILKYTNAGHGKIEEALRKGSSKYEIRNTAIDDSGMTEKTIELKIKEKDLEKLLYSLKAIKGMKKVMIFSHTGELSE